MANGVIPERDMGLRGYAHTYIHKKTGGSTPCFLLKRMFRETTDEPGDEGIITGAVIK